MHSLFNNPSSLHGRFIHIAEAAHQWQGFTVLGDLSGWPVCSITCHGGGIITAEWDAYFVSTAMNHVFIADQVQVVLNSGARKDGWKSMATDFPLGFEASLAEFEPDTGQLSLRGRNALNPIRLILRVPRTEWADTASAIGDAASRFFNAVSSARINQ